MELKLDPRIIRSRKLIMDSFIELSMKKEFKDITIKDITELANVNRSTFYSHFIDKYDLLDKALNEIIMKEVIEEINKNNSINIDTIDSIFSSIVKFKKSIGSKCNCSYKEYSEKTEAILKKELQNFFSRYAKEEWPDKDKKDIEVFSVMLSWALYGAVEHFMENKIDYKEYIKHLYNFVENLNISCSKNS